MVLAGAGGQGVLTAARILTAYFSARGAGVVSGQLHGMAQRGGVVRSFVKVNRGLAPAVGLGTADVLLGFEPVECVRALDLLAPGGTILVSRRPVVPFTVAQAMTRKRNAGYPAWSVLEAALREVSPRILALEGPAGGERPALVGTFLLGAFAGGGLLGAEAAGLRECLEAVVPAGALGANLRTFAQGERVGRAWAEGRAA